MANLLWRNPERRPAATEHPFTSLQSAMNTLFDDFFTTPPLGVRTLPSTRAAMTEFNPRIDVRESANEITVAAELPGLSDKDVHITLDRDYLTIKGEKKFEKEGDENDRQYIERSYGSFMRTIPLTTEVDRERVEATFRNGVLKVALKKTAAAQNEPRRITIKG